MRKSCCQWIPVSAFLVPMLLLLQSCAIRPPDIQPFAEARRDTSLKRVELIRVRAHARSIVSEADLLAKPEDARIGADLRRDLAARANEVRARLQSNETAEIQSITADIESRVDLVSAVLTLVPQAEELLGPMAKDLSPDLVLPLEQAIQASQAALINGNWDDLNRSRDELRALWGYMAPVASLCWAIKGKLDRLDTLGHTVGPSLRQQVESAVQPLFMTLRGDSWSEALAVCRQLPAFVKDYPSQVVADVEAGQHYLQFLQPAERQKMQNMFAVVDEALQGASWEVAARETRGAVSEVLQRFGGAPELVVAPCVRILSIDGGGVRGIIPAMVLQALEQRTKQPIHKLFDYVVGTSAGGIIALGLSVPNPENPSQARYNAAQLVEFFEEKAAKIFPPDPLKTVRSIVRPKYSPLGLEQVLEKFFGPTLVAEALTNVLITTYNLEERRGLFMSNYNYFSMLYMREAARATSAAPTYFPPAQMAIRPRPINQGLNRPNPSTETLDRVSLLDGGVYANNPAAIGLTEIRYQEESAHTGRSGPHKPWLLLSLGTGQLPRSVPSSDPRDWGLVDWASPLVDIMFSNPGVDVRELLAPGEVYDRLQPWTLNAATASLDNSDPAKINALKDIAREYVKSEAATLDRLSAVLLRERPPECRREPASIRIQ